MLSKTKHLALAKNNRSLPSSREPSEILQSTSLRSELQIPFAYCQSSTYSNIWFNIRQFELIFINPLDIMAFFCFGILGPRNAGTHFDVYQRIYRPNLLHF